MVAIFILAVLSIVVAGMATYTVYTSIKTSEMLTLIGRNASQMDSITAVLKSSIRAVSSYDAASGSYVTRLFLPTPDVDAPAAPSMSFVPSWIQPNSRTPWGSSYGYCAYAPMPLGGAIGAAAATTPLPYASAGGTVASGTHDLTAPDGSVRSYMVSGGRPPSIEDDQPAPAVLGFVISPTFNSNAMPSCNSIAWRGGAFRTVGNTGIVLAITDDAATRSGVPVPATMTRYASPAGGGDGGSAASAATLSDTLAEWKATHPPATVVYLSDGNHTLAPGELNLTSTSDRLSGRNLRLVGTGASTIANSGAAAALTSDADVVLDGVNLGAKISLWPQPGSRFQAFNSQLRYVLVDAADMVLGQGASVSAAATDVAGGLPGTAAVDVRAGRLTIKDSGSKAVGGSLAAAVSAQGGWVSLNVGSLAATGSGPSWAVMGGGARVASLTDTPTVTWNGSAAPSVLPAGIVNGSQRTVETSCTTSPCVAQCMAQPAAGTRPWFALSGSCSAAAPGGGQVTVVESGVLANSNAANLPTDWQCRFASVASDTVPAAPLPSPAGTARAICSPVPVQ